MAIDDLKRYRYGSLAHALLETGDVAGINESLNALAKDLEIGDKAEGFIAGSMASEQGINAAVGVYAKKRTKALESSRVEELGEYFKPYVEYADAESVKKIQTTLAKYSGKTLGEIKKIVDNANVILKGKDKYPFKQEEIDKAKKTAEEYAPLFKILDTVDHAEIDSLLPGIRKKVHGKSLEKIAKDL